MIPDYASPWGGILTLEKTQNAFLGSKGVCAYWRLAPRDWDAKVDEENPPSWIKPYLIDDFTFNKMSEGKSSKGTKWTDEGYLNWMKLGQPGVIG